MEKIDFVVPLTVSNPRHKTPGTSANPSLSYHAVPFPELVQKRYEDRVMFTPGIDLKQYTCRAVVDWIRLECRTSRRTQSVAVGRWFKEATGVQPHVSDPSKTHDSESFNHNGASFGVKIQNPNPQILADGFAAIGKKAGLEEDPTIIGIEISVDWFPKDRSDDRRLQMTAALMRHHLPARAVVDLLRSPMDDLRYTHESQSNPSETHYVIPKPEEGSSEFSDMDVNEACVRQRILRGRSEQEVYLDSTVYRGERGGGVMFSYQNKVSDRRNPKTNTAVELRPEDRRSRIEVTLLGDDVSKFGFTTLSKLRGFRFEKLNRRLFTMYLPTFGGTLIDPDGVPVWPAASIQDGVKAGRRKIHINAFREGGIYGLDRLLDASQHETKRMLMRMLKRAKAADPELAISKRPRNRIGTGDTGNMVAWQEINKRHSYALTNLSRYWK